MRLPLLNLCNNVKCLNFLSIYIYVEVNWKVTWPKIRNKLDTTIHDPEKKSLKLKKKKKKKPIHQQFLMLMTLRKWKNLYYYSCYLKDAINSTGTIHFCWEIQARLHIHIHTNICKFELEVTTAILFSISNSLTQIQSWVAEGKSALEI